MTTKDDANDPMESILKTFDDKAHVLERFMENVVDTIEKHPDLSSPDNKVVHSSKCRLKNRSHLREKIERKFRKGRRITPENLFNEITDLAGVRILHLFQSDFEAIDKVIREQVAAGDWFLSEQPRAYTWDPETEAYFKEFDLKVIHKPSSYTSVHYLVRPRQDSPQCCEIQVRTLFEEIWGEVDHRINYPTRTNNLACKEQIQVLSKIVGAGSRLLDSLQRVHEG